MGPVCNAQRPPCQGIKEMYLLLVDCQGTSQPSNPTRSVQGIMLVMQLAWEDVVEAER